MTDNPDYEIIDIIHREGGVCILIHIPSLDKDISVNSSLASFNAMTEYEINRQIEESVKKFIVPPTQTMGGEKSKIDTMKEKLVGPRMLKS